MHLFSWCIEPLPPKILWRDIMKELDVLETLEEIERIIDNSGGRPQQIAFAHKELNIIKSYVYWCFEVET